MDPPFCKICGEKHWLGHCPEWDEPPPVKPPASPPVLRPVNAPKARVAVSGSSAGGVGVASASPVRPKFDKRAYQRELMRKRRAAARAQ